MRLLTTFVACWIAGFTRLVRTQSCGESLVRLKIGQVFRKSFPYCSKLPDIEYMITGGWFRLVDTSEATFFVRSKDDKAKKGNNAASNLMPDVWLSNYKFDEFQHIEAGDWAFVAVSFDAIWSWDDERFHLFEKYVFLYPGFQKKPQGEPNVLLWFKNVPDSRLSYWNYDPMFQKADLFYLIETNRGSSFVTKTLEVMMGILQTHNIFSLRLNKYFLNPVMIDGTSVTDSILLGSITRSGIQLKKGGQLKFPDMATIYHSGYKGDHCINLQLQFTVERHASISSTSKLTILFRNSLYELFTNLQLDIVAGGRPDDSVYFTGVLQTESNKVGGIPINSLAVFKTRTRVCTLFGKHYLQNRLWINDEKELVDSSVTTFVGWQVPSEFPLDLSITRTCSRSVDSECPKVFLRHIKLHRGNTDFRKVAGGGSPKCLGSSFAMQSDGTLKEHCTLCREGSFLRSGSCLEVTSLKNAEHYNSSCSIFAGFGNCEACLGNLLYNKVADFCKNAPCPQDMITEPTSYCSSPLTTACSMFQEFDGSSCVCKLSNCMECQGKLCTRCIADYYLNITEVQLSCSSSISSGFGINRKELVPTIRPCLIYGCSDCMTDYSTCDICTAGHLTCLLVYQCHSSCLTCNGSRETNCTSCPMNQDKYLHPNNTCGACVSEGQGKTSQGRCIHCASGSNCHTCPEIQSNCTLCIHPYRLLSNKLCSLCAASGNPLYDTVSLQGVPTCSKCSQTCKTCNEQSSSDCLSCYAGFKLAVLPASSCIPENACTIPNQYYVSSVVGCLPCLENCKVCANGDSCFECLPTFYLYQGGSKCMGCADLRQTILMGTQECIDCDSTCSSCSKLATNCTACSDASRGTIDFGSSGAIDNRCIDCSSIEGMFKASSSLACATCGPNCKTCYGEADNCTSCDLSLNYYLKRKTATTWECGQCPTPGYYIVDDKCLACDLNCLTCSGGPSSCTDCPPGKSLLPSKVCTVCSMEGYTEVVAIQRVSECLPCEPDCKTCSGLPTTCSLCQPGLFLFVNSRCVPCTKDSQYIDGSLCKDCDSSCQTCAQTSMSCTSCPENKYLYVNQTCHSCTEPRLFKTTDGQNVRRCISCDEGCETCESAGSCTSCQLGLYKYRNGSCAACEEIKFFRTEQMTCLSCHETCKRCHASSANNCTECFADRFLNKRSECQKKAPLLIVNSKFYGDLMQVVVQFSESFQLTEGKTIDSDSEIMIFKMDDRSAIEGKLKSSEASQSMGSFKDLIPFEQFKVKSSEVKEDQLVFKLELNATISGGSFVMRFKHLPLFHAVQSENIAYTESCIIVGGVDFMMTGLDEALVSVGAVVGGAVTTVTTLFFLISIPQAFILMKVFQTVDYYIHLDCDYPINFCKFLDIISQNLMEYMPNLIEKLADDEGDPVYPRFQQFGVSIHLFKNLGQIFTLCCILAVLKGLLWGAHAIFAKTKARKFLRSKKR